MPDVLDEMGDSWDDVITVGEEELEFVQAVEERHGFVVDLFAGA
jgi:hypothetical protein